MPVPGETLDADRRDIAAKTAEALEQRHRDPGTRRADRGGEPAGTRADNKDIGLVDDVDLA